MLKKSAELIVIKRRWRPIEKPVVLAAVGDQLNLIFSKKVEPTCKLIRTQVMELCASREVAKTLASN